jgi:beta-glucosidase
VSSSVTAGHAAIIRDIGSASTVLLKNTNSALPLNKPKSLALIGSAATANPSGPNGSVSLPGTSRKALMSSYHSCTDRSCDSGTLAVGWGSG